MLYQDAKHRSYKVLHVNNTRCQFLFHVHEHNRHTIFDSLQDKSRNLGAPSNIPRTSSLCAIEKVKYHPRTNLPSEKTKQRNDDRNVASQGSTKTFTAELLLGAQ